MDRDLFLRKATEFLSGKSGLPAGSFRPDAHLVREGLVDSLLFMQLIEFVEAILGERLPAESFSLDRFATLDRIHANFLAGTPAGKAA
jgi:hypothetical protein